MELWDVLNRDREKTGKTMVRGAEFDPGAYHVVVHICVFSTDGRMLIQQRQPFKQGWANMWDISVGGSAVAGESTRTAAMRELKEELGIALDLSQTQPHLTINFDHGFDDFYLVIQDVDIETLELQYEEVQRVRWASWEEIHSLIAEGVFIPYQASLIDLLFENRFGYGCHTREE